MYTNIEDLSRVRDDIDHRDTNSHEYPTADGDVDNDSDSDI